MNVKWTLAQLRQKPTTTVAVILVCALVLVIMLVWGLRKALDTGVQTRALLDGTVSLMQPTNVPFDRLPRFKDGSEYGVGIWLYLNELPQNSKALPILSIGNRPVFSLTPGKPEVTVSFPNSTPAIVQSDATFDHVSLKRWVHLLAVHSDGSVSLFKDGELSAITRVPQGTVSLPTSPITLAGSGAINAFVGQLMFLNHYPSAKQVKREYRRGPTQGSSRFFSMIGFTNFGLRSPVYRL